MFSYPGDDELNAKLAVIKDEIESVLISYQLQHQMTLLPLRAISNKFNSRCRKFPEPKPTVNILLRDLQAEQRLGVIMSNTGKYFVVAPIMWKDSLTCEDLGGFQWQPLIDARERWLAGPDPTLSMSPPSSLSQDMSAFPDDPPAVQSFSELLGDLDDIRNKG